jgi:MFS family permease
MVASSQTKQTRNSLNQTLLNLHLISVKQYTHFLLISFFALSLALTRYSPKERGARIAIFYMAQVFSGIIGGLVAAPLLSMHAAGLQGWRWLFIIEVCLLC